MALWHQRRDQNNPKTGRLLSRQLLAPLFREEAETAQQLDTVVSRTATYLDTRNRKKGQCESTDA